MNPLISSSPIHRTSCAIGIGQGRTIANDVDPASVIDAFTDAYRVLKPNTFCISFYGWNRVDAFFRAWHRAGFHPVGHLVWHKDYASSTGFLRARQERAYLLACNPLCARCAARCPLDLSSLATSGRTPGRAIPA